MAVYYLSGRSFTSKAGRECFVISLLTQDNRGNWQGVDKFVDEDTYELCLDLKSGYPVRVTVDLSGHICGLELDQRFLPLRLDFTAEGGE